MHTNLTDNLKENAMQLGADLVGIADLEVVKGIETIPVNLLDNYTRAVVIAFQVSPEIFKQMKDEPTPIYAQQYSAINQLLDQIQLRLQSMLLRLGYKALAIPASQTIDKEKHKGQISTKALAIAAGVGWQGKSSLLVTPEYGPRVRIASLLTNAPLVADKVIANRCGSCTKCKEACPGGAIYGVDMPLNKLLRNREEAIDLSKCVGFVTKMAQRPEIGAKICGICIKVCPWSSVK